MIDLIKRLIGENKDIDAFKIIETREESSELFLIKKDVDMNREKDVHYYNVVIYRDFEEDGKKYRGSAPMTVHPSMNENEVSKLIEDGAFAAGFVKNDYYPLPKKSDNVGVMERSSFESRDFNELIDEIALALYKYDTFDKGGINSCEIFLNKKVYRLVTSEGVDLIRECYNGMTEFVTTWKEDDSEEVELYKAFKFSGFDGEIFANRAKDMILRAKGKAQAGPTPKLKDCPVILNDESVKEFFRFYLTLSDAGAVYQGYSNWKVNAPIQGEDIKGDKVTLKLDPLMKDSSKSSPFDRDGLPLEEVTVFKDGVLNRYHGNVRNSYYLGVEPTGDIVNYKISGGSKSTEELKKEPHLEISAFSDFSLDPFTGDFGGEIRLAWYFDGEKTVPVSGGSITGNVLEVQKDMYLSSELQQLDYFVGPALMKLEGVNITGIK